MSRSTDSCASLVRLNYAFKNPASILDLYKLQITSPVKILPLGEFPKMEKLKNLLRPSLVVFTFAACAAVAECGGHATTTQNATAAPSPSPAPSSSPGTAN